MNLVIRKGPPSYVIEKTSFVKINDFQLLGITLYLLRGQKLAEKLIY
jgi:hypothetical protein